MNSSELSVIEHIKQNPELNKYIDKQKHIFDPNTANKSAQNPSQYQYKFASYDPQKQYLAQMAPDPYKCYGYPSVLPQSNISYLYPSQPYMSEAIAQPTCNPLYDYNITSYNWFKDKASMPYLQQYQPESFYNAPEQYMAMDPPIAEAKQECQFKMKKSTSFNKNEPNKNDEAKPLSRRLIR